MRRASARRRRASEGEEENLERWLLTYADLITLLLAFFIIMYSMSKVDSEQFSTIMSALNGVLRGSSGVGAGSDAIVKLADNLQGVPPKEVRLRREIDDLLEEHGLSGSVQTRIDARGVVMTMGEKVLFDPGKAELKESAKKILDEIAAIIAEVPNEVRIEGHTDNVPIHNEKYASNWELSVARSTSVIRYLLEKHHVPPEKLSAAGCGEYRPIKPNDTPEHRAMNRRVDIVLIPGAQPAGSENAGGKQDGRG